MQRLKITEKLMPNVAGKKFPYTIPVWPQPRSPMKKNKKKGMLLRRA